MSRKYRRDGTPYPSTNEGLLEWARDFEKTADRIVKQDRLSNGYFVSTVWLGLDHNWLAEGPPLIFETMVFSEAGDDVYQDRYSTEDDAIIGHIKAVERYAKKGDPA